MRPDPAASPRLGPAVDLSDEMASLADRLAPPRKGAGRVVQFVAARRGEGTSTVAREFARAAARRGEGPVWLVELDVLSGAQFDALACEPAAYGELGDAARASPDDSAFVEVDPPSRRPDGRPWPDAAYLAAYPVGGADFWVVRLRREALTEGQEVRLSGAPDYWRALRRHAAWVVIDAPAGERSRAAALVAPHMDATLLVVAADDADAGETARLRDGIEAAGGRCGGIVLNRAAEPPPRFLRAFG